MSSRKFGAMSESEGLSKGYDRAVAEAVKDMGNCYGAGGDSDEVMSTLIDDEKGKELQK